MSSMNVEACFRNCGICTAYSEPDQCTCHIPQTCNNKCMTLEECRNSGGICVDKCFLGCICEFATSVARPAGTESLSQVTDIILTFLPVLIVVGLLKKFS